MIFYELYKNFYINNIFLKKYCESNKFIYAYELSLLCTNDARCIDTTLCVFCDSSMHVSRSDISTQRRYVHSMNYLT